MVSFFRNRRVIIYTTISKIFISIYYWITKSICFCLSFTTIFYFDFFYILTMFTTRYCKIPLIIKRMVLRNFIFFYSFLTIRICINNFCFKNCIRYVKCNLSWWNITVSVYNINIASLNYIVKSFTINLTRSSINNNLILSSRTLLFKITPSFNLNRCSTSLRTYNLSNINSTTSGMLYPVFPILLKSFFIPTFFLIILRIFWVWFYI